ncbi:Hpt domain-containing protein [Methylobacter tundripaludum]|uniref:Hpt domain-containing protein n=1 Tax=Methylobacter tundripaludum TaxID=173365 RepID=A0A2S6H514_9GAMM|nr:Hpt domain-containing protein [Methylobacter tundripaludum]PPK72575.1 Hpt domain-containing protein [Methylobacter tundripaludum]
MDDKEQRLSQQLDAMNLAYAQKLPDKIAAIKADWQQLRLQPAEQTLYALNRKVHGLIGSGATFGFAEVSKAAQALEDALSTYNHVLDTESALSTATVDLLLAELENAVNADPGHGKP